MHFAEQNTLLCAHLGQWRAPARDGEVGIQIRAVFDQADKVGARGDAQSDVVDTERLTNVRQQLGIVGRADDDLGMVLVPHQRKPEFGSERVDVQPSQDGLRGCQPLRLFETRLKGFFLIES